MWETDRTRSCTTPWQSKQGSPAALEHRPAKTRAACSSASISAERTLGTSGGTSASGGKRSSEAKTRPGSSVIPRHPSTRHDTHAVCSASASAASPSNRVDAHAPAARSKARRASAPRCGDDSARCATADVAPKLTENGLPPDAAVDSSTGSNQPIPESSITSRPRTCLKGTWRRAWEVDMFAPCCMCNTMPSSSCSVATPLEAGEDCTPRRNK
mmetsp:Transcript_98858/g.276862  ORF Transcript_98858/g.276862 Transcript_98858/m.276862 type:complete len:214 (+) Transcript_98858:198-839(+)